MRRCGQPILSLLLLPLVVHVYSQQQGSGAKDPSPHVVRFVSVDDNVRLEVLDWGGSGRPLVLLAGGGDTAHVFDDFAPKLTPRCHVYAITRRGFGESGFSPEGYGAERLGEDVLVVLDALKLSKPVLAGHSIAGEELSAVANRHPDRIAGVVYLDAAYPYAIDNGEGPSLDQFQKISGPQAPPPNDSDLASFSALQHYYLRVLGFTYPEGELRQQWICEADGAITKHRDFPGYATILSGMKKYGSIPVPVLAIFAVPHGQGKWVESNLDPKIREAAEAYSAALTPLTESQINVLKASVPSARVIVIKGAQHHIFLSNEADVLREMHSFLGGLEKGRD